MANEYSMTISRMTVDKLGVKLYDRVSAVLAELIANSYDADAQEVTVRAPMGEYLASKTGGVLTDKGHVIEVEDDGHGMTPQEVQDFYLKVGAERRMDAKRGDKSKKYARSVMGRKGVGKLAPFGVCRHVEIITSGGERLEQIDENGTLRKGYLTANIILDRDEILSETDAPYYPKVGAMDGTLREKSGTLVRLTVFQHRQVPNADVLDRQLAQKFGLSTANWKIVLENNPKDAAPARTVGQFEVATLPATRIDLQPPIEGAEPALGRCVAEDGKALDDLAAGFVYEERQYPLTGWIAYSKQPYKDDLMAGIRVYCRGKLAAQTHVFNLKAGFTGEFEIRSYLVGEMHADWLDEAEDLIRTDRQDILWSHDLGRAFEEWGQRLVKKVGAIAKEPRRKKAWERFREASKIEELVEKAFPAEDQSDLRDRTLALAKILAQNSRDESLNDAAVVEELVRLSFTLAPHLTLTEKLKEAAELAGNELVAISAILRTARLAELASFGRIAVDRVRVIQQVEKLKDDPATLEAALQQLLEEAPWLVNTQWSPITANENFATLRKEFVKYYKQKTGKDIVLQKFDEENKRVDFIMHSQASVLELVEIKKPDHALSDDEFERVDGYVTNMEEFLAVPGNEEFAREFPQVHITLVCDKLNLKGVHKTAFEAFKTNGKLTHVTWTTFLKRARKAHEAFLKEAERQYKIASEGD